VPAQIVYASGGTSNVVDLYKFKLTALVESVDVSRIIVNDAMASVTLNATTANGKPTTTLYNFELWSGTTKIAGPVSLFATSTPTLGGYIDFNMGLVTPLNVAPGAPKTLTLKADFAKSSGNYAEGATSTWVVGIDTSSVNAEDGASFATATVSGSQVTAGTAYVYLKAPKLALASTPTIADAGGLPSGSSGPQRLNGELKFAITAQGGDIYVPVYSATTASNGLQASAAAAVASITITQTFNSDADYGDTNNTTYVVRSGQTKTFTLNSSITGCDGASADEKRFNGVNLDWIKWGTTVATAEQPDNSWTWGLTSFKTPQLELLPCQ